MNAYLYYYDTFVPCSFEEILSRIKQPHPYDYEVGFIALTWLIGRITRSFQGYIAIVALITVLPIAWLYNKNKKYQYLEIVLFMQVAIFTLMFSGIRQSMVVSLGIFAYELMRNKRFVSFVFYVFFLSFFHKSALVLLLLPILYYVRIKKKHLIAIVPMMLLLFVFKERLLLLALNYVGRFSKYKIQSTGAYATFILLILITVFSFVIPDETKLTKEQFGLRNILLFSAAFQSFASIHTNIMRVNFYFLIFVPFLVPQIIINAKPQMRKLARQANVIMCVFFTVAHIIDMYTGADILKIYPYQFFWEI